MCILLSTSDYLSIPEDLKYKHSKEAEWKRIK
jgi:hypothetical protein